MDVQYPGHRATNVRASAEELPSLTGRAGPSKSEIRRRGRGLCNLELLALAALRRYGYERRALRDAKPTRFHGRPTERSNSARFDGRIIRCIDFERCLKSIGEESALALQLYYVDGYSQPDVAEVIGISPRTLSTILPKALAALALALDRDGQL